MLNFIRRERIYILLLFFILAVNVINSSHPKEEYRGEEKPLSASTFKEMGVTEERVKEFFESKNRSAIFFKYAIISGFFIFIIGIILNLGFIFRGKPFPSALGGRERVEGSSEEGPVSWGISDLIRVSIIIIFMSYVVGIVESFIFRLFRLDAGLNLRMILGTFFIDIGVGAVILYFVMVKYRESLQSLGLRFSSFFRNILSGITAYIFILPLLFVILVSSVWLLNLLGYSPPPQPVFEVLVGEKRGRVLFFLTIFVSVFGPVIEEVFFRGFMYSAIKKRLGVVCAIFLSASIFSALHTNIAGFLPIMALGALLAYLYETTGSLVASMTVHIVHNSIIVGFVFFIKELIG